MIGDTSLSLRVRAAWVALATLAALLCAASAPAVTLCIAPCNFVEPPPPTVISTPVFPPLTLEPLSLTLLAPEGGDLEFAVDGDLRILLTGGMLEADLLQIRSNTTITLAVGVSFDEVGLLDLCAPDCVDPGESLVPGSPADISVQLAATGGVIRLAATGNVTVLPGAPAVPAVPEPSSALLMAVGFGLVSRGIRRARVSRPAQR